MADKRKVRVYCKNLSKWFRTITEAARFAGVDGWSMSKKMEVAGSFVDNNGNEYIRERPMRTKNQYENTGTTLKRNCRKGLKRKPSKVITSEKPEKEFVYAELPKPVRDLIDEKIVDMCNNNRPWFEIREFMLKMGCKEVTIRLKDTNYAK